MQLRFPGRKGGQCLEQRLCLGIRKGPLASTSPGLRPWELGCGAQGWVLLQQQCLVCNKALLNLRQFLPFGYFGFNSSLQGEMASLDPRLSELGGSFGMRGRELHRVTGSWGQSWF